VRGEIQTAWTTHPTTAPMQEPLTLDEAKSHCSITQDDDNALVNAYLMAAREAAEQYMGRALFTQTRTLKLSDFADVIWLPYAAPLQSVTSVQYYDADGSQQTLSTTYYEVDTTCEPGRVIRKPDQDWPEVQSDKLMPVTITYVCGWSSVDSIPELIKQGMRLSIASMDQDRTGIDSSNSRRAAESLWSLAGCVHWREPELCRG
jgi:uncharacterized phiE125 gp8 family phage protein